MSEHVRRQAAVDAARAAVVERLERYVAAAPSVKTFLNESRLTEATLRNWRNGKIASREGDTATANAIEEWATTHLLHRPDLLTPSFNALVETYKDALVRLEELKNADPAHPTAPGKGGEPEPGRRRLAALAVAAALLVGSGAVITVSILERDSNAGSSPSAAASAGPTGSSTPELPEGVTVDANLILDETNFCKWRLGESPIPLESVIPLVMQVDARCNYPANPDPTRDEGASVYSLPSNDDKAAAVGTVRFGNAVEPVCYVPDGDLVTDGSEPPNASPIWLQVNQPRGYLPNVNLGGGYTATQLDELGLPRCT